MLPCRLPQSTGHVQLNSHQHSILVGFGVLVAATDTIWRLFASILGIDSEKVAHATQNTSVSCVSIDPGGMGVTCEFQNRTPHLLAAEGDHFNIE